MKIIYFVLVFTVLTGASAYCGGLMELVNEQEIGLDNINSIEIAYHSEEVTLFKTLHQYVWANLSPPWKCQVNA